MNTEEIILRAGLLAGMGAEAKSIAKRMAFAARSSGGRSCFDGGGSVQFAVDAPGTEHLQVALRLGDHLDRGALGELMTPQQAGTLVDRLEQLPPSSHDSFGSWLHWREHTQAVYFDLRDEDADVAMGRLLSLLDEKQQKQLAKISLDPNQGRLWAAKISESPGQRPRILVYWLLHRFVEVNCLAESTVGGSWPHVVSALGQLLKRPGRGGRWVVTTDISQDSSSALRLNNTAWTIVPEDHLKQRAVGRMIQCYGGPRKFAESLWSLCRSTADARWRVGRACEVVVKGSEVGTRLYFSAQATH